MTITAPPTTTYVIARPDQDLPTDLEHHTHVVTHAEDLAGHRLTIDARILFATRPEPELLAALVAACSTLPAVDTRTAARILGVTPAAISMWKRRELIFPAGLLPAERGVRGGRGIPLYRLVDLLPLAAAAHQHRDRRGPTRRRIPASDALSAASC